MLFEIDVTDEGNSPYAVNRVFDLLAEPNPVNRVYTADPLNRDGWRLVTGWSSDGPCPASAVLAEDSGDGVILLIYGGDQGIRLQPEGSPEEWSLDVSTQWGEPCLMLDKNTPVSA